jgi:hypothetical protein
MQNSHNVLTRVRPRSQFLERRIEVFDEAEIVSMYEAMQGWLAGQQVQDKSDPYFGAVWYPSERRYDNRDTGCAALAFWRMFQATGKQQYRAQANLARDYVLAIQEEDGGYAELTFDNKRIDEGSAVNTGMIALSLIRAYEAGFEWSERDIQALSHMADFLLTLEWTPGGFYHDQNHLFNDTKKDCQNTTALAGVSLCQIHRFLSVNGYEVNPVWMEAAQRTLDRLLEGQDITGQWPYRMGMIDIYPCDMNHHGMLMLLVGELYRILGDERLLEALILGGQWLVEDALLPTPQGSRHNWTFQRSACLYFTAGYFFTSSALAQLAVLDRDNALYWREQAVELLRYVRNDLWDNPAYETEGPFLLTEAGMAPGYAWHGQAMAWCTYLMDHVLVDLELQPWE